MGANYPRHNSMSKLNFHMGLHQASYKKADPPCIRVLPLPINIVHTLDTTLHPGTPRQKSICKLIRISFSSPLIQGEYCKGGTNTKNHPFRLRDIQFFMGKQPNNSSTKTQEALARSNFIILLFTTNKNNVKGKSIGLVCNSQSIGCPVVEMRLRVVHL